MDLQNPFSPLQAFADIRLAEEPIVRGYHLWLNKSESPQPFFGTEFMSITLCMDVWEWVNVTNTSKQFEL